MKAPAAAAPTVDAATLQALQQQMLQMQHMMATLMANNDHSHGNLDLIIVPNRQS
eukprot:COSAG02_NODE_30503_length_549_cov_5.753333_1_plen_55_part_00